MIKIQIQPRSFASSVGRVSDGTSSTDSREGKTHKSHSERQRSGYFCMSNRNRLREIFFAPSRPVITLLNYRSQPFTTEEGDSFSKHNVSSVMILQQSTPSNEQLLRDNQRRWRISDHNLCIESLCTRFIRAFDLSHQRDGGCV